MIMVVMEFVMARALPSLARPTVVLFRRHFYCGTLLAPIIFLHLVPPSPSPTRLGEASDVARVGWERVAARPGEGLFMGRTDLRISDAHWGHEPNPISRSSRGLPAVARRAQAGNEALIFSRRTRWGRVSLLTSAAT